VRRPAASPLVKWGFIVLIIALWEAVSRLKLFNPLLFPSVEAILKALWRSIATGEVVASTAFSLQLILVGMGLGLAIALVLAIAAMLSRVVGTVVETMITIFDPIPGMAILPLAILWFGTGQAAIVFIIVHSVVWPMVLAMLTGFRTMPRILLEVGRNLHLRPLALATRIRLPAALPSVIHGVKVGWARAWRALIAAEMVFGATGAKGGLGWLIYQKRFFLDLAGVFAGLIVIMLIGMAVEDLFFAQVEKRTIRRWGMVEAG
jgi:NitT/TauT family transport system permease protein